METLRILVADDSEFMQATYKKILETDERLRIIATASDGAEAIRQAKATMPDVAILDIKMPNVGGIEAARQIVASCPGIGIVIISSYEDTQYFVELQKLGAQGKAYILKTSITDIDLLIRTVAGVARGETILDPYFGQEQQFPEGLPQVAEEHLGAE